MKIYFLVVCIFLTACSKREVNEQIDLISEPIIKTETILTGYEIIWGMDLLPNGDLVFGEKRGKLFLKKATEIVEITGLPSINSAGQGGLLDIRVHPNFNSNGWIYCTYSGFLIGGGGANWNLARFNIIDKKVSNWQILLTTESPNTWNGHFGSRIEFDDQGYVYATVGEGGTGSYGGVNATNMNAQNVKSVWGKVHRLTESGSIPNDNPVLTGNIRATSVFTYGHRNPQGLAFNNITKELWETEHGPKGGDEINILKKGTNYGWPLVSFGTNYDGVVISSNPLRADVETPIHYWTPSIAPSGMAFITSNSFKKWKGNLLCGSLAFSYLVRCELNNGKVAKEYKMLENIGRVRNIKQAPDGSIYVSIEGPGRIIQIKAE